MEDRLSKTVNVLLAAAEQVKLEDRLSSTDALLRVSEQIAEERGLTSPVRKRSDLSQQFFSVKMDAGENAAAIQAFSPRQAKEGGSAVPTVSVLDITDASAVAELLDDAADELLKQARIKPITKEERSARIQAEEDRLIQEDALALTAEIGKKEHARNAARIALSKSKKNRSLRDSQNLRDHYFGDDGGVNVSASLSEKSRVTESTKTTIRSSLSAVGSALKGQGTKSKSTTESLFRNMKVVSVTKTNMHPEIVRLAKSDFSIISESQSKDRSRPRSAGAHAEAKGLSKDDTRKNDDRLSKPKQSSSIDDKRRQYEPDMKYTLYDEVENCTFRPKLTSSTAESKGGAREDGDEKNNFIQRQEATARNRREELDFKMGQADYAAKIDKKECPVCGAKQSYDEVKEKRKQCPNCRVSNINRTLPASVIF
jgi:ribosomal protein S27AE